MPSSIAHAAAGLAVATAFRPDGASRRYWWAAGLCAVLPDLDALGRPFTGAGGDLSFLGGHRGFTHSIAFAVGLGAIVAWGLFRDERWRPSKFRLWLCFALATATHGVLDALNARGEGVTFFSPFSDTRIEFAWQPIDPHPAALAAGGAYARFYSIIGNELLWVIIPCALVMKLILRARAAHPER